MTTYQRLIARAKDAGHKLTPELKADLKILADVPDSDILRRLRKRFIQDMAREFQVPVAVMEVRCEGSGPYLQEQTK